MRLSFYQYDIAWEDPEKNLLKIEKAIKSMVGSTDLLILPEMATTGFSMNPERYAETMEGYGVERLKALSMTSGIALIGSFMIRDNDGFYNRAILFTPNGELQYYDKRHLFRMGTEAQHYLSSNKPPTVFEYKGWNIRVLICYDLRFPVWSRNVDNGYDLLIYMANWPKVRGIAWNTLLAARAIENMAYVCGVNRIGTDGNGIEHEGESQLIDFKGTKLNDLGSVESIATQSLDLDALKSFRTTFPAWKDADLFELR